MTPTLQSLLREAADALWLIPQHAGLAQRLQHAAAEMTRPSEAEVLIWSDEHKAWWRANRAGYCADALGAGVYSREEAEHITAHCGPEKRIVIRSVREVLAEAAPGCLGAALSTPPLPSAEPVRDDDCGDGMTWADVREKVARALADAKKYELRVAFLRRTFAPLPSAEELRQAVLRYGWHDGDCAYILDALPCTCGLDAVEDSLK